MDHLNDECEEPLTPQFLPGHRRIERRWSFAKGSIFLFLLLVCGGRAQIPLEDDELSSSLPPLQISPTPASSVLVPTPPPAYFITGLANTRRTLDSALLLNRSQIQPFLLHFRTDCAFGTLLHNNEFNLSISPEGNLSYQEEGSPSESIWSEVADGVWHSLLFNGSSIQLDSQENHSGSALSLPLHPTSLLRLFDGFVGCIRLGWPDGTPLLPQHDLQSEEEDFSFAHLFQLDTTPSYAPCADPHLKLWEVHPCPTHADFLLCRDCEPRGRCEVTEIDDVQANTCRCTQDNQSGRYCEEAVPDSEIMDLNETQVRNVAPVGMDVQSVSVPLAQATPLNVTSTSSRPGRGENYTTSSPQPPTLYPSPPETGPPRNATDSAVCPCQHGGVCLSSTAVSVEVGAHICSCEGTGFYGERCEFENTFCRSSPCVHGICQPKGDSYQCYCLPGFAGSNCDTNFNECLSNPCGRNGECQDDVNAFRCHCHAGYTGVQCEVEIDECESHPCLHGGRCQDAVANYTCHCLPGFEGHDCSINIDDCESSPCQNGGGCIDGINQFSCNCTDTGFEGYYCDREINECLMPDDGSPCENGAECEDGIKAFTCHCHPGYTGERCETDVQECLLQPCRNNGTCLERSNASIYNAPANSGLPTSFLGPFNYSGAEGFECICPAGFEGSDCSIDIDECAPRPCLNGRCVDLFNQFRCECHDGYKGNLCEVEINECESSPCKRGECVDKVGDYACVCPEGYGAQDCSVELTGCTSVRCFNAGTCTPTYTNATHSHKCSCAPGWAGPLCKDSTTLSFSGSKGGYAEVVSDDERFRSRYAMSFRFRTTLSEVLMAVGQGSTYFMLTLSGGKLNLQSSLLNSLKGISSGNNVSNADWHTCWVAINETHIALGVNQEQTIHPIQTEPEQPVETGFNTTVLGGATSGLSALTNLPSFVGCIQDIQINDRKIVPAEETQRAITYDPALVKIGCKRTEQCSPSPCGNSGTCGDLWTKFECKCPRPFLGEKCEHEYTAGTFGHENTSLSIIEVHIPNEVGRKFDKSFEISMFVRTREPRGTIFLLKDERRDNGLFLEAYVEEDGQLGVLARLDEGKEETYKVGGLAINDGEPHLISIQKERGLVKINVNGTEHFRKSLPLKPNTPFNPAVMYIGGIPPPPTPPSSSTEIPTSSEPQPETRTEGRSDVIQPSNATTPESNTPSSGPGTRLRRVIRSNRLTSFKGVIQDVRVNLSDGTSNHHTNAPLAAKYVVEFFPLNQVNKSYLMGEPLGQVIPLGRVLEGVVSDDACLVDPCLNGGFCETTWNDFRCICPEEYDGKTCEHLLPCALVTCPSGALCRNLFAGKGFECQAEAAFDGRGTLTPHYHLRSTAELDNLTFNQISFRYRSQSGGSLLHIEGANGSSLRIALRMDEENAALLLLQINGSTTEEKVGRLLDGSWHTLLFALNQDGSHFTLSVDGQEKKTALAPLLPPNLLNTLLLDTLPQITLGSALGHDARSSYPTQETDIQVHAEALHEDFFRGCMDEVMLGPFRLPFVSPVTLTQLNPENQSLVATTAPTAFYMDSDADLPLGCVLCYDAECENGGVCTDPHNVYQCHCPEGFQGSVCQVNIDECGLGNECAFGSSCVDGVANYTCACSPGYTGWLCSEEVNECESNPCSGLDPGAVCLDRIGSYVCTCSPDYIGVNCESRKLASCKDDPCEHGAICMTTPTQTDGTNFSCSCPAGYTGRTCAQLIDYCLSLTCSNGGTCLNKRSGAECRCVPGFAGPRCQRNVDDCASSPCHNGGICIDGINSFSCNCTGYSGPLCEEDIDECAEHRYFTQCPLNSTCYNSPGSFECMCSEGLCGADCDLPDPCPIHICHNDGICRPMCNYDMEPYAECDCAPPWGGANCTQRVVASQSSGTVNVLLILIPVLTAFLLAAVIAGVVLVRMARKKRATRGVYSPSAQEFSNPRIELDNVLKPPPEERLI